jgi:hypothetical protein
MKNEKPEGTHSNQESIKVLDKGMDTDKGMEMEVCCSKVSKPVR